MNDTQSYFLRVGRLGAILMLLYAINVNDEIFYTACAIFGGTVFFEFPLINYKQKASIIISVIAFIFFFDPNLIFEPDAYWSKRPRLHSIIALVIGCSGIVAFFLFKDKQE